MREAIRQRARELGFDDCRVTTADPPASAPKLQRWLAQRWHGEMAYLERNAHKRVDPQQVLPAARSIITLAVSYAEVQAPQPATQSPEPQQNPGSKVGEREVGETKYASPGSQTPSPPARHASRVTHPAGLVARYARYQDYHDVLAGALKQLTEYVNGIGGPGTRSLWYVDTGPLLERDLGQRAGLGFIGKHTNLINRQLGNWILLAEIITTLKLEPDQPEKNRCGSCTRCIAACPTAAITAPFQLDARRCISYLTIELKGPIPLELRPAIGNRIFGCDDCLAVCPWNRFAREGKLMKTHTRPDLRTPDLLELISLDEAEFKHRFAGTPLLRARRRGLLRNICVALGNIGDATALGPLQKAANDTDPIVAEHAAWAIDQIRARRGPSRSEAIQPNS